MSEGHPVRAVDRDEEAGAPAAAAVVPGPSAGSAVVPGHGAAAAAPDGGRTGADGRAEDGTAPSHAPAEPQPLGVTVAGTGNADVDAAVERLGDADELPVHDHIQVYEDVHVGLRNALAALDENRG